MALFKILKGNSTNLKNVKATDGYAYFTPDDGKFYIDIDSTNSPEDVVVNYNKVDLVNNKTPNRICINPEFTIIDCGTSDLSSSIIVDDIVQNNYTIISGGNA